MTASAPKKIWAIEDYYRIETDAEERHEFDEGEILTMSGGSPEHALIALNVGSELRTRLKGRPCRAYGSDLRVRVGGRQRVVYPDMSVICGAIEYDPDDPNPHTVLNPRLIVEVLSPSTERYDRTQKFDACRPIKSLREYALIWQETPRVEAFARGDAGAWTFETQTGADAVVRLKSLEIEVPLAEVYAGVICPPEGTGDAAAR